MFRIFIFADQNLLKITEDGQKGHTDYPNGFLTKEGGQIHIWRTYIDTPNTENPEEAFLALSLPITRCIIKYL